MNCLKKKQYVEKIPFDLFANILKKIDIIGITVLIKNNLFL